MPSMVRSVRANARREKGRKAGSRSPSLLQRAEAIFSGVLHLMAERSGDAKRLSSSQRAFEWFIVLFDAFQLASFVLQRYSFPDSIMGPIWRTLSIWRGVLPSDSPQYFYITWSLGAGAAFISFINAAFVGYMLHTANYSRMLPVYTLKSLVTTLITFGYLPFLELLALPLRCSAVRTTYNFPEYTCWDGQDLWMPLVSLIMMSLFIPMALALSASHFENNPFIRHPAARPSGRFDFVVTLVRTAMVIMTVITSSLTLEAIVSTLSLLLLTATIVLFVPYYEPSFNQVRCGLFSVLTLFCIVGSVLSAADSLSSTVVEYISIGTLIAAPIVFVLGFKLAMVRATHLWNLALDLEEKRADVNDLKHRRVVGSMSSFRGSSAIANVVEDGDSDRDSSSFSQVSSRRMSLGQVQPLDKRRRFGLQRRAGMRSPIESRSRQLASVPQSPTTGATASQRVIVDDPSLQDRLSPQPLAGAARTPAETTADGEAPLGTSFIERGRLVQPDTKMPGLFSASDIEVMSRHLLLRPVVSTEVLRTAEDTLKKGMDMFPDSAYLAQQYAAFLMMNKKDGRHALVALDHVETLYPALDIRFQVFTTRRRLEQQESATMVGRSSLDAAAMIEFKKHSKAARRAHSRALKYLQKMWKAAAAGRHKRIRHHLRNIIKYRDSASQSYERLLIMFPSMPSVLREYAQFKQNVLQAPRSEVDTLLREADELEESQAQADAKPVSGSFSATESIHDTSTGSQTSSGTGDGPGGGSLLIPARAESTAVVTTSRAVMLAMLVLLAVDITTFIVTSATLDFLIVTDLDEAGIRRTLTTQCTYYARELQLGARSGNMDLVSKIQARTASLTDTMRTVHTNLYAREKVAGPLYELYTEPSLFVQTYNPASGARRAVGAGVLRNMSLSLWSAGNKYINECGVVATLPVADLNSTTDPHLRFIYDNGMQTLLPASRLAAQLYEDEIFEVALDNLDLQIILFLANMLVPLLLAILIASLTIPVVRKLETRSKDARMVLDKVPRMTLRKLSRAAETARHNLIDPSGAGDEEAQLMLPVNAVSGESSGEGADISADRPRRVSLLHEPDENAELLSGQGSRLQSGSNASHGGPTDAALMQDGDDHKDDEDGDAFSDHLLGSPSSGGARNQFKLVGSESAESARHVTYHPEARSSHRPDILIEPRVVTIRRGDAKSPHAPQPSMASHGKDGLAGPKSMTKTNGYSNDPAQSTMGFVLASGEEGKLTPHIVGIRSGNSFAVPPREGDPKDDEERSQTGSVENPDEEIGSSGPCSMHCSHSWMVASRLVLFLILTSALSTMYFLLSSGFVRRAKFYSSEVNRSGERLELKTDVMVLLLELLRNDGEIVPNRDDVMSDLTKHIHALTNIHTSIAQGNDALNLLGSDNRDPAQHSLLYGTPCLRQNCSVPDTRPYAHTAASGLDALVWAFADTAKRVQERYRGQTGTLSLPEIMADDEFAMLMDLEANDISTGISQSVDLFIAEADRYIDSAHKTIEDMFIASLIVLVFAYLFILRAIPKQLSKTGQHSRALLHLFPQDVIRQTTELRALFVEKSAE